MGAWARPLRLPLSSGDTGFRLIALVGLGGALAFGPLFFLSELPLAVLGVGVPAIAVWSISVAAVARAMWSARASDVLVDVLGMEIFRSCRIRVSFRRLSERGREACLVGMQWFATKTERCMSVSTSSVAEPTASALLRGGMLPAVQSSWN